MIDSYQSLLEDWKNRCEIAQQGHYFASTSRTRFNYTVGITLIVISGIIGLLQIDTTHDFILKIMNHMLVVINSIFRTDMCIDIKHIPIISIILSTVATVLANIQLWLDYNVKAVHHQNAATEYGNLKRKVELLLMDNSDGIDKRKEIENLLMIWEGITSSAPITPKRHVDKSKEAFVMRKENKVGNFNKMIFIFRMKHIYLILILLLSYTCYICYFPLNCQTKCNDFLK